MTSLSVIVSTYDRPEYLERVLVGYAMQTDRDFELVIADDGSGQATSDVIAAARKSHKLSITHARHEHLGFRKTVILNRAIVASAGEYLLFTDGDCIPREDLIATHRRLASDGRYVAGGYVKLPPQISNSLSMDDIDGRRFTDLGWLRSRGWKPGRRALRLTRSWRLGSLYDFITPTAADFHGNNASVWRDALYVVNGFEGEMGYGGLDQALGYRLQNAGIKGIQARHRAVTMHLHHDRPYRNPEVVRKNREIMKRIKKSGESRARLGIAELAEDPTFTVDRG
ncbi:MAG TPA: glycosyltransferase [Gemmatimonadaceae bacterium]